MQCGDSHCFVLNQCQIAGFGAYDLLETVLNQNSDFESLQVCHRSTPMLVVGYAGDRVGDA